MSGSEKESLLITGWTPSADRHQELIDGLLGLFERYQTVDGFIEGRVLVGSGGTAVLSYLRMRSAADQQRLEEDPEIQAGLDALQEIAHLHRDVFDLVWVFARPGDEEPVAVSRGAI